jgi:hypothetical protein
MPTLLEYSPPTSPEPTTRRRWTWLLLALPSAVIPFVHFDCDASPVWVVTAWIFERDPVDRENVMILAMAAGLIAGLPLFLWRLRLLWRRPISQVERTAAFVIAIGTLLAFLIAVGTVLVEGSVDKFGWVALGVSIGLLATGLVALWLTRRHRTTGEFALTAMLVPYVAHATLCVIAFIQEHQLGWYLALVSTPAAIAEIIVLSWAMLRRPRWERVQKESPALTTPGQVQIDSNRGLTPPNPAPP